MVLFVAFTVNELLDPLRALFEEACIGVIGAKVACAGGELLNSSVFLAAILVAVGFLARATQKAKSYYNNEHVEHTRSRNGICFLS